MEVNICIIKDVSRVITYVSEKYWGIRGGLYLKCPMGSNMGKSSMTSYNVEPNYRVRLTDKNLKNIYI